MKYFTSLYWLLFCLSTLTFSAGISWHVNSKLNFAYPMWYQALDIEQHIKKYAPQNTFNKSDFVNTKPKQHSQLFAEVVESINNHGNGLENISYIVNSKSNRLFTKSEVVHLQDVSKLIDKLAWLWFFNLLPLSLLSFGYLKKKLLMPNNKVKMKVSLMSVSMVLIGFITLGFNKIFYYLHTLIFPDNHQWFFYYQESIMTTFMKAPDLFAAIGLNLFLLALFIFIFSYKVLTKSIFIR